MDIRHIADKFPEKNGGLKDLFDKGPQDRFFLVKFWVSVLVLKQGFISVCVCVCEGGKLQSPKQPSSPPRYYSEAMCWHRAHSMCGRMPTVLRIYGQLRTM